MKERTEILSSMVKRLEEQEKETKTVQELFLQLLRNYPDGAISIIDKEYHFLYTGGDERKKIPLTINSNPFAI